MMESVDWQTPNDAYLYFLGLGAEVGKEPLQKGERLLTQIRANELTYDSNDIDEVLPHRIYHEGIELPDSDAFCGAKESTCLPSLFVGFELSLNDPKVIALRERYLTFMGIRGFRSLTKPHFLEPLGGYSHLVRGNRLVSLWAIEKARACCPEEAIDQLYDLIQLQQEHVREVDTLIGRMTAYVLLHETIEVLSMLLREFEIQGKRIPLLSSDDLRLDQVLAREIALYRSMISYRENQRYIPAWMVKTVFKPNMTFNASVPVYSDAIRESGLPPESFAVEAVSPSRVRLETSWLRNSVGTILNKSPGPNMANYIARGLNINAKISLFNSLLNKPVTPESLTSTSSPFYEDERPASFNGEGDRVCFSGPLPDQRLFRCLIVKVERRSKT
jgi:hypothetical protein